MPAIQPARLRQQAALVVGHFDEPAAFTRSLHHLFEFYEDRSRRPGQSGQPGPILRSYNIRQPVLRHLLLEMAPEAKQNPGAGLALCDRLWEEPYLEFRVLAAMLLGQINAAPPEPVVQRLQQWITPDIEDYMLDTLLVHGLVQVRETQPQAAVRLVENWLLSEETFPQQVGLRALIPMIEDPDFENLPVFFRLIQPLVRSSHPSLHQDLLDVLAALAQRSPQETAYFLRQGLDLPSATDTAWLIRQSLGEFPADLQDSLRSAARGRN